MTNLKLLALLLTYAGLLLTSCSKPPTISVKGAKSIQPMDELKLSWESTGATSVEIEGIEQGLPPKGEISLLPQENTTYIFKARYKNKKPTIHEFKVNVRKIPLKLEYFRTSPKNPTSDDKITMQWKFQGADTVTFYNIPQVTQKYSTQGEEKIQLEDTTFVRILATNRFGEQIDTTFKVNVKKLKSFKAPDTTYRNEPFTLEWNVAETDKVSITNIGDDLPAKGSATTKITATQSFTLTATKKDGSLYTETVEVEMLPTKIMYFKAQKVFENGGEVMKLQWRAGGVEQVSIPQIANSLPSSGAINIENEGTIIYEIIITDENGKKISKTIQVEGNKRIWNSLGSIQRNSNIKLPRGSIYRGESTYLVWNLPKEVISFQLEGFPDNFQHEDSIEISPVQTTTYRINAKVLDKNKKQKTIYYEHTVQVIRKDYIKNLKSINELPENEEIFFDIIAVDRSDYPNSLKIRVIVTDKYGNFISDLAPPYCSEAQCREYFLAFAEKVNGEQSVPIQNFQVQEFNELTSKPYSIALSMDYSGSMGGEIEYAEAAAIAMIDGKHPKDEFSIIKFDHEIGLEVETPKKNEVEILRAAAFDGKRGMAQKYGGGTALYAGADAAIATVENAEENKLMILLTDGQENSSFGYVGQYAVKPSELVKHARSAGVRIYTIAYGMGTNFQLLKDIANYADGQLYTVYSEKEAKDVYNELSRIFHNYYEITFKPTVKDGEREISLTYYDNKGDRPTTTTQTHFGDDLSELDKQEMVYTPASSGGSSMKNTGLKPLSAPQAVAHFDANDDEIEQKYHKRLNNIAEYLKQHEEVIIEVWGHSDLHGTEEETYGISIRRAEAIKTFLVKAGISEERITAIGWGKTKPVWQIEEHDWQRHENRRIEVVLFQ